MVWGTLISSWDGHGHVAPAAKPGAGSRDHICPSPTSPSHQWGPQQLLRAGVTLKQPQVSPKSLVYKHEIYERDNSWTFQQVWLQQPEFFILATFETCYKIYFTVRQVHFRSLNSDDDTLLYVLCIPNVLNCKHISVLWQSLKIYIFFGEFACFSDNFNSKPSLKIINRVRHHWDTHWWEGVVWTKIIIMASVENLLVQSAPGRKGMFYTQRQPWSCKGLTWEHVTWTLLIMHGGQG